MTDIAIVTERERERDQGVVVTVGRRQVLLSGEPRRASGLVSGKGLRSVLKDTIGRHG
jgi:hypothetical protein